MNTVQEKKEHDFDETARHAIADVCNHPLTTEGYLEQAKSLDGGAWGKRRREFEEKITAMVYNYAVSPEEVKNAVGEWKKALIAGMERAKNREDAKAALMARLKGLK